MAQAAAMGPPLSPREIRRSGRRSAPSASTSTSKSPDSDQPPRQKENIQRQSTSGHNGGRNKRLKLEDIEDVVDDRRNTSAPSISSVGSTHTIANGKPKRRGKDKDKHPPIIDTPEDPPLSATEDQGLDPLEDEEQGITRCVCGSSGEDDPDAGEFMVQCETCKVWQHGLCMGYQSEDQVHDDDYYCEQCRPELHVELLKKLSKRPRHSSAASHHTSGPPNSRVSRSHSPSHMLKQPSKRRNTMNSRDAAFDESLKEIMEATAAEAAAVHEPSLPESISNQQEMENEFEAILATKKKRKRSDDDASALKKRTRSASSGSDRQGSTTARPDTPVNSISNKAAGQTTAPAPKMTGRNRRGARKNATVDPNVTAEVEEAPSNTKRSGNGGRAKSSNNARRPPISHVVSNTGSTNHEHGTRRNQSGSANGQHTGSTIVESSRAYRNSHAYAILQQPLYTSWNLPDYLAHLEEILPTDTPQPLEVRGTAGVGGGRESVERTMERGVKVKWPSKRMSVGDMNKRVRALVEWVGREQASAHDRERRREALERALKEEAASSDRLNASRGAVRQNAELNGDIMIVDEGAANAVVAGSERAQSDGRASFLPMTAPSAIKLMEELMEELIGFQERFGPGAKSRERRQGAASAS